MITLRELSKTDRAIGAITTDECHLIAAVLDLASRSRIVRWLMPKAMREKQLALRMLAATLGRTPEERAPSLQTQIKLTMEAARAGK